MMRLFVQSCWDNKPSLRDTSRCSVFYLTWAEHQPCDHLRMHHSHLKAHWMLSSCLSCQHVLNSHSSLSAFQCNGISTVKQMFLRRHRLYIHKGWHGTAMVIAHIIKINTMLRWPMGLVRQNRMVPLGVIVKQQTLHHTFPNSIREGTCRMSSKYWGDLVLCCVGKKKRWCNNTWCCNKMTCLAH